MTPNPKPTCYYCGEDIEPDDETHEDEGLTYHADCFYEAMEINEDE